MRLAQLRHLMYAVNSDEGAFACKHGHGNCAARPSGRCSDEAWNQQCSDESDEDYERRLDENDFLEEVV